MAESDALALSEDQHALQDTLRGFLADRLPSAALRAALETEAGYSPELHARLAGELGLTGLMIPEEFGGLGMSQAEASVVHTELGRALYPGPFLSSGLAAGVLLAGDRAARSTGCRCWPTGRRPGPSPSPTRPVTGRRGRQRPPSGPAAAGGYTATGGTSSRPTWPTSSWSRP